MWPAVPLLIEFIPGSRIEREPPRAVPLTSTLPVVGNGPPGTSVHLPSGRRVPLPTDQIVLVDQAAETGAARIGMGGMRFDGLQPDGLLRFTRVRDLRPAAELSPERRNFMTLETGMVATVVMDGRLVWPIAN